MMSPDAPPPLISILVPVYNDAPQLPEMLSSVCQQTFAHWELLCVNDGSTDGSGEILSQWARQDARIRVFHQSNQGQQRALLSLLPHIRGQWVLLLHADDALHGPAALAGPVSAIEADAAANIDGFYAPFATMDAQSRPGPALQVPARVDEATVKQLAYNGGSNPIPDHFFCRSTVFFQHVVPQYLCWNTPYWLRLPLLPGNDKNPGQEAQRPTWLCLRRLPTSWYRYRVYAGNYITSPAGQFVMSHGALRTTLSLARWYWPLGATVFPCKWLKKPRPAWRQRLARVVLNQPTPFSLRARLVDHVLGNYYGAFQQDGHTWHPYHQGLRAYYQQASPGRAATLLDNWLLQLPEAAQAWQGLDAPALFKAWATGATPTGHRAPTAGVTSAAGVDVAALRYFFNLLPA
jgi:glycosyltransferase involved in cell wall biosynthesis